MSQIGVDFLVNFILNHHHTAGSGAPVGESSQTISGKIQSQLKKLLHFQKTRDAVIAFDAPKSSDPHETPKKDGGDSGKCKSIFFCFILRCVSHLLKEDNDDNLLRYLRTTKADIYTQMKEAKLPSGDKAIVSTFMKAKAVQIVLKMVLQSTFMAVMSKGANRSSMT